MSKKAPPQMTFGFTRRGGVRRGAGRKPKVPGRPGVSHQRRAELNGKHPVHVTMRIHRDVPNLRRNALHERIFAALRASRAGRGFRLCHFVVMGNHVHMIVEAESATRLARGIQGLCVRLARRVNAALGRRGRFFADRYHAHVLRTPTEVHRALAYVLLNLRKHDAERGSVREAASIDGWSSGAWFAGWLEVPQATRMRCAHAPPIAPPQSWLLSQGWRKVGDISLR